MFCIRCETKLPDEANFCWHCGEPQRLMREQAAVLPQPGPKLELLAANGYKEHGYAMVDGLVKNISSVSLHNVEAVIIWQTASGELVKTASALINYNPILPGQTSPFKALTTDNPAMTHYKITFQELSGGMITLVDSRGRK